MSPGCSDCYSAKVQAAQRFTLEMESTSERYAQQAMHMLQIHMHISVIIVLGLSTRFFMTVFSSL